MKKQIMKLTVTTSLLAAMMCSNALAAETTKNVQIQFNDIKLVVDGVPITPKDANGSRVEPFIYNGTTYLPIRAVGEAIGKQVTWDGATKTIYLGESPNENNYLIDLCPPYEVQPYSSRFKASNSIKMGGKTYAHGFIMYGETGEDESYALFNLNGDYSALEFDLGHVDGSRMYDGAFNIYLDGKYTQTIEIGSEDPVKHISLPLDNALQLKIATNHPDCYVWGVRYGFANAKLIK